MLFIVIILENNIPEVFPTFFYIYKMNDIKNEFILCIRLSNYKKQPYDKCINFILQNAKNITNNSVCELGK